MEYCLRNKSRKKIISTNCLPEGGIQAEIPIVGRSKFDPITLSRSLFKIGLGIVAYDRGADYACEKKFDSARDFINGKSIMRNHLIIMNEVKTTDKISIGWVSCEKLTLAKFTIFGILFLINLEPSHFAIPKEAPHNLLMQFWLGKINKDKVYSPCPIGYQH